MKFLLIGLLVIFSSCGKDEVVVTRDGPEHFLVFDPFCSVRIKATRLERTMNGTRRLRVADEEVVCRRLNVTKREYLGRYYDMEEVFEDGERAYIINEDGMDNLYQYLIHHGLIVEK